jgi:hypothetical protein
MRCPVVTDGYPHCHGAASSGDVVIVRRVELVMLAPRRFCFHAGFTCKHLRLATDRLMRRFACVDGVNLIANCFAKC